MTNFGQKVKWLKCTKFDQMSRVGSRDRHAGWRSKNIQKFTLLQGMISENYINQVLFTPRLT